MTDCVTPWKIPYSNRGAAKQELRESKRRGTLRGSAKPYPCGDHWHLSSMAAADKRRVGTRTKTAARRARKREAASPDVRAEAS